MAPHDNVQFVCTDGKDLAPWQDRPLDVIYSLLVFQQMPRAEFSRYVREAGSKLVPGGPLVFQIPIDETGENFDPPPSHPYGLRHYRRREVAHSGRCRLSSHPHHRSGGEPGADVPVGNVVVVVRTG